MPKLSSALKALAQNAKLVFNPIQPGLFLTVYGLEEGSQGLPLLKSQESFKLPENIITFSKIKPMTSQ